jgi:hypothetical protein
MQGAVKPYFIPWIQKKKDLFKLKEFFNEIVNEKK